MDPSIPYYWNPNTVQQNVSSSISRGAQIPPRFNPLLLPQSMPQGQHLLPSHTGAPMIMTATPGRMMPAQQMVLQRNRSILASSSPYLTGMSTASPMVRNCIAATTSRDILQQMVRSPLNIQATQSPISQPLGSASCRTLNIQQNVFPNRNAVPRASVSGSPGYLTMAQNVTVPRAFQLSVGDRNKMLVSQVNDLNNRKILLGACSSQEKAARACDTAPPVGLPGFHSEVPRQLNFPDAPPVMPTKACQPLAPEEKKERPKKRANRKTTGPTETLPDVPNKEGQLISKDEIEERPRKRANRPTTGPIEILLPDIPNKEAQPTSEGQAREHANRQTTGPIQTLPDVPKKEGQPISKDEIEERPRKRANWPTTGPIEMLPDIPNKEAQPTSEGQARKHANRETTGLIEMVPEGEVKEQARKHANGQTTGLIEIVPDILNKEAHPTSEGEVKEQARKRANGQTTGPIELLPDILNKEAQPTSEDEMKEQAGKHANGQTTGLIETPQDVPNKEGQSDLPEEIIKEPETNHAIEETTGPTEAAANRTSTEPPVDANPIYSPILKYWPVFSWEAQPFILIPHEEEPENISQVDDRLWDYSTWVYES